jgi:3-oxoacyl-[acyl-carrier protein] reductase
MTSVTGDGHVLTGKRALITAAASGMGRAAAILFAAEGAHVIAVDVRTEPLEEVVTGIRDSGGSAEAHTVDLTDPQAVDTFLDKILATHQVLDVLYNHAGLRGPEELSFDHASWTECVTINLWTPMVSTQRLLPLLRRSDSASIIYTSSTAGLRGTTLLPTYSATKAGLIYFMRSMAVMLGPEGIRANAICPGSTDTRGMRANHPPERLEAIAASVPLRRMGDPEDLAAVALFLASDASRYVTGVAIPVDGGATA